MDSTAPFRLRVHFDGIIELLARNLYADPDVFVREMIQNAHDAIQKRRVLAASGGEEPPAPRIRVTARRRERTLEFSDNGAGLTEEEIHEFLSTIGASDKQQLRRRIRELTAQDRPGAASPIGRFGIGLLSGFIVAGTVEVETRSVDGPALRWTSSGDGTYQVRAGSRREPGTTVLLRLRPEHEHYLERETLERVVRRYADVIGVPIHLGRAQEPANRVHAPWHLRFDDPAAAREAHAAFWSGRFRADAPLEVIPLAEPVRWVETDGTERMGVVRGVLGITDRSGGSADARGMVDVYVARMFVAGEARSLLPDWATFVSGVVECDALEPNAARDNVLPTPALAAVREALGRAVIARLTWMAYEEPVRLHDILRWHAFQVLVASLRPGNEEFFQAVADLLPLESDQGPVTLRTYRRAAEPLPDGRVRVHYAVETGSRAQFSLLAGARGQRVLHAGRALVEPFLLRYQERWPERIELVRIDREGSELIAPAGEEEERALEPVAAVLRSVAEGEVHVSLFDPPGVPMVTVQSREAEQRLQLRDLMDDPAAPPHLREALGHFLERDVERSVLHLNARNPLVRALAAEGAPLAPLAEQAVRALYHLSVLAHARSLGAEQLRAACAEQQRLIEMAVGLPAGGEG